MIFVLILSHSKDPVEDQLDSLTSMLQDALKTESMDSIPTVSSSSSQYSTGSAEGNGQINSVPDYQAGYRSFMRIDSGIESLSSSESRPAIPFVSGTSIKLTTTHSSHER